MVTEPTTGLPVELVEKLAPVEFELSETVVAVVALTGFPKASCRVTVMGPRVALLLAVPLTAPVRANLAAGALAIVTVTGGCGAVRLPSEAVME